MFHAEHYLKLYNMQTALTVYQFEMSNLSVGRHVVVAVEERPFCLFRSVGHPGRVLPLLPERVFVVETIFVRLHPISSYNLECSKINN